MMIKIKVLGKIKMKCKNNKIHKINKTKCKKNNKNNVNKKINNKWYKLQKKEGRKDRKVLAINKSKDWKIIHILKQVDQLMVQDNNKDHKICIFLFQHVIHIVDQSYNSDKFLSNNIKIS